MDEGWLNPGFLLLQGQFAAKQEEVASMIHVVKN